MNALSEDELKMFVDSVRHYFKTTTTQEPQITSAFLATTDVEGYDFNGIVTFSGAYNGHVIVSTPSQLLKELLLLQGETDLSDGNLLDAVGEIANTLGAWVASHGLTQFRLAETDADTTALARPAITGSHQPRLAAT